MSNIVETPIKNYHININRFLHDTVDNVEELVTEHIVNKVVGNTTETPLQQYLRFEQELLKNDLEILSGTIESVK